MTLALNGDTISVELEAGVVPAQLYAGGTTGLVLLADSAAGREFCARLGELAESAGLSALAFAGEVPGDRALAAATGVCVLDGLGVARSVVVGVGTAAAAALRAAADGLVAAVTLIDPVLPLDELEPLLADVPAPKLMLVRAADAASQATADVVYRYAIGPIIVRHLWGDDLLTGETAAMAAEAMLAFAVGACGDGRPA